MRLAYFSPLNPQKSGISDYSEELLPALALEAEIDLFVDGFIPTNMELTASFETYDYRKDPAWLERLPDYDAVLCQMGNNHRCHSGIYEVASRNSAITVFHDYALQHFFLERSRELHDISLYLEELGADSRAVSGAKEALVQGAAPPEYYNPLGFPMNFRLANRAEGIIVHSEWSRSRFSKVAPGVPLAKINHHVKVVEPRPGNSSRAEEPISIASFGFITASKGLESAIRALAALKPDYRFRYYLVGEPDSYFDVEKLISLYGMGDRVSITDYVNLEEFTRRIAQTDIAINLRDQTVGETSGSLCRLMAAGVPTLVSNIGWFSELPDDCVVKIDPVPEADLLVCAYVKELMENEGLRRLIGTNARRLMQAHHRVEQTAESYLEFIGYVITRRAQRRFFDSVAYEIARLSDSEPQELLLNAVAPAISELGPK